MVLKKSKDEENTNTDTKGKYSLWKPPPVFFHLKCPSSLLMCACTYIHHVHELYNSLWPTRAIVSWSDESGKSGKDISLNIPCSCSGRYYSLIARSLWRSKRNCPCRCNVLEAHKCFFFSDAIVSTNKYPFLISTSGVLAWKQNTRSCVIYRDVPCPSFGLGRPAQSTYICMHIYCELLFWRTDGRNSPRAVRRGHRSARKKMHRSTCLSMNRRHWKWKANVG